MPLGLTDQRNCCSSNKGNLEEPLHQPLSKLAVLCIETYPACHGQIVVNHNGQFRLLASVKPKPDSDGCQAKQSNTDSYDPFLGSN